MHELGRLNFTFVSFAAVLGVSLDLFHSPNIVGTIVSYIEWKADGWISSLSKSGSQLAGVPFAVFASHLYLHLPLHCNRWLLALDCHLGSYHSTKVVEESF